MNTLLRMRPDKLRIQCGAVPGALLLSQLGECCGSFASLSSPEEEDSPQAQSRSFASQSSSKDAGHKPQGPVEMGEVRSLLWEFSAESVKEFCRISGDSNPIHWDESAARSAGFDSPIVPGMQCSALFPAIIGTEFPGSVYMSQTLRFRAPVQVGEPVRAVVEVVVALPHRHRYKVTFATKCIRERDSTVAVDGIAVSIIPGIPVTHSAD